MDKAAGRALERAGAALLVAATIAVSAQRVYQGNFLYTVWADRGLTRSSVPFSDLPTMGPELSYGVGARIPGGGFNLMLWLAERLTADPLGVWRVQVSLDAVAALVLGLAVGRRFGALSGAVSAALFLSADANTINQVKLWNPAWMSLWVALAIACWLRAVAERSAAGVVAMVVCVAVAAQMHVTAWLLLPALTPSLVTARIPRLWSALVLGLGGALLTLLPYAVSEVGSGFANTRLILHPTQTADVTALVSESARPIATVWDMLLTMSGEPSLRALPDSGARWVAVSGALAPLLVIGVLHLIGDAESPRAALRRRIVAGLLLALVVELVAFARARHFGFRDTEASRYLMAITPVSAALVGVAASGAVRAARAWGQIASALVLGLVLSSSGARLTAMAIRTHQGEHSAMSWPRLPRWIEATEALTGWDGADLTGRLVVVRLEGERWVREEATPIDAMLGPGDGFAGSRPPPCGVLFNSPRPLAISTMLSARVLADTLGSSVDRPDLGRVWDLMPGLALALYTPASGRCPSTMTQRYILRPEEAVLREATLGLRPHQAARVDAPSGHTRWVGVLDASGGRDPEVPLPVWVDVARQGAELTVTLSSNSLRGHSWNHGFFVDEDIRRPRLEITAADGRRAEVLIEPGAVGGEGALTPLSATATVPFDGSVRLLVDLPQPSPNGAPPIPPVVASLDLP